MRVTKLKLRNFGMHDDITLDLDEPEVYVVGENAVGKTTVADAIEYAFTGDCRSLNGRKADRLRRRGVDGAGGVRITVNKDGQKIEWARAIGQGPHADIQSVVETQTGIRRDLATACLQAQHLVTLPPKERSALLAQIAGIDSAAIREAFQKAGWNEEEAGEPPTSLSELRTRHDQAYGARRNAKRDLTGPDPTAPDAPEPWILPGAPAADAQKTLDHEKAALVDLRAEQAELMKQHGEQLALHNKVVAAREAIVLPVEPGTPPPSPGEIKQFADSAVEMATQAENNRKERAEIRAQLRANFPILEDLKAQIAGLKNLVEKKGVSPVCPLCNQKTTKAKLNAEIKKLDEVRSEAATKVQKAELGLAEILDEDVLLERAQRATKKANDLQALLDQWETYREDMDKVSAQEHELMDARQKVPDEAIDLAGLGKGIEDGERLVESIAVYVRDRTRYEDATQARLQAEERIESLERYVKMLRPGGEVESELLVQYIQPFIKATDSILEPFGYAMTCDPKEGDVWFVRSGDGSKDHGGTSLEMSSTSERLRLGLAMAAAFSKACGLGFIVVDGVDAFDRDARAALREVRELAELDQVICTATIPTAENPPQDVEGVRFVVLERAGGVAREREEVAA